VEGSKEVTSIPTFIALDTETGGIAPETTLLTAYFVVLDQFFQKIADLDLRMKPEGPYIIEPQALEINKINLAAHDKSAIPYKQAGSEIYDLLWKTNPNKLKLIPIGHNVAFDIERVCANTLSKKSWDNFVGYRKLDTGGMAIDRQLSGHLPWTVNAGLASLAEYFGVQFEAHTAKGDTWATIKVCQAMLALTCKD
jgi:DNA polymerase III epsilon subunit-like protein